MAFTGNYSCNTLRSGLIGGTLKFATDTFRLALYTNAATLDQTTTAYTSVGESSGGDYVAGGKVVVATVNTALGTNSSTIYVNFSSPVWNGAITARGALIYDVTTGAAVCVLDFGNNVTSTSTFTVTMPANTSTAALIRLV
jgi:hypothetical protein